jgi:hypothetical protein
MSSQDIEALILEGLAVVVLPALGEGKVGSGRGLEGVEGEGGRIKQDS